MPTSSSKTPVLIGVLVIVALAGGLFLYSNRASAPATIEETGGTTVSPTTTANTTPLEQVATTTDTTSGSVNSNGNAITSGANTTAPKTAAPKATPIPTYGAIIKYYNTGFSPNHATIFVGQAVRFENDSDRPMWIASNPHPVHTNYPLKAVNACGGSDFDECVSIGKGEHWDFIFKREGSWGFHNHMRGSDEGTIYVKEVR